MHIFELSIKAGPVHSTYPQEIEMAAVCMVDSRDTEEARRKACDRLFELGWQSITFEQTVLLAPEPDISSFDSVMTDAYKDAKRLGVSLIEFPEHGVQPNNSFKPNPLRGSA